jgi:hypothetical protein
LTGVEQSLKYDKFSSSKRIDAAGYESDGGEEVGKVEHAEEEDASKVETGHADVPGPSWGWRFNKSPMGESCARVFDGVIARVRGGGVEFGS